MDNRSLIDLQPSNTTQKMLTSMIKFNETLKPVWVNQAGNIHGLPVASAFSVLDLFTT